ncbi:MAG: hypothetical protein AUJ04_04660 [Acidobacteria bacterium 13_1_40CM_3_55_6]|nr:MAG: hypothetical protein AUJ04_04660 [Acidobacteria bacterium 13_1_40CM_3_55_6]
MSFEIFHLLICERELFRSEEKNYLRCQISNDPVATAPGSDAVNKSPAADEERRGSGRTRYLTDVLK